MKSFNHVVKLLVVKKITEHMKTKIGSVFVKFDLFILSRKRLFV